MNGNLKVLIQNAFVTKKDGLGINFLDVTCADTPKFKGRGGFTCFYENKNVMDKLTPECFEIGTVLEAEYFYEESYGGTGRKKIKTLYVPLYDGEVQTINLLV